MKILKALALCSLILLYIIIALPLQFLTLFMPPWRLFAAMARLTRAFCLIARMILRIRVLLEGKTQYRHEQGNCIITNHLGYLDGIVLGSLFSAVFVSKLQVKSWPLFGLMTQLGGTIYIDRSRKLKAAGSVERISNCLKNRLNILFFPEGTSTDGSKVLPFQSIFFQAALNASSPIVPNTIQYLSLNSKKITIANRDNVFWYGQVSFAKHLLSVLGLKGIEVKVTIHPKIESKKYSFENGGRKQLAEDARRIIMQVFFPVA